MNRVRRLWAMVVFVLGMAVAAPAYAVDVSQLSDFEANPCVIALSERNVASNVGAPDSALADACERAHDNVEVAWDFLTRVWLPHDVAAASASYVPALRLGTMALALALLEMVLVYLVLGAPIFAIALALRRRPVPRRLLAQVVGCVIARVFLAAAVTLLMTLPVVTVLSAIIVLIAVARLVRRQPPAAQVVAGHDAPPSALAEIIAGVINDTAAAAPGLVALVLVARGQWRLVAFGLLLSILFALSPVVRARRTLRRTPLVFLLAGAVLALGAGSLVLSDLALAGMAARSGAAMGYVVPIVFAAIVLWRAPLLDRFRPGRRHLSGG